MSVCFVLCDKKKWHMIGGKQHLKELDVSEILSYATFPAIMERSGIPLGPQLRQCCNIRRSESVIRKAARLYSSLKATGSPRLTMQHLDAHDLASGDFIALKVVAFTQLQDIKQEDVKETLEAIVDSEEGFDDRWFSPVIRV